MPHFNNISEGLQAKHRPGRPPGTGPKQRAALLAQAQGETIEVEKRPVGRPHKYPRFGQQTPNDSGVRVDLSQAVSLHSDLLTSLD